jgi:hypothetical protein
MAQTARVRNLVFVGHGQSDEIKRVRVHLYVRNGDLNRRHMARHALTSSRRGRLMVRAFFERNRPRAVKCSWRVAFKTNRIRGFAQLGVIAHAVDIMTTERPDLLIRKNALRARRPEAIVDNPFQLAVAARLHVCARKGKALEETCGLRMGRPRSGHQVRNN